MKVIREDFERASAAGIIEAEQVDALWSFLCEAGQARPQFRAAHVLYYLGGFIAISALALFVGVAWDALVGWPMLIIALGFAWGGIVLTRRFLERQNLAIPAGVTLTFAVSMTPLVIFNLQHILGVWAGDYNSADYHRYIDWRWIPMELATLITASIALWRYRLPFTVFLVGLTLWYLQMDLVPFLFHDYDVSWDIRKQVSVLMGLLTMGLGFWVDIRSGRQKDYGFWLYLFGVMAFWGGLSSMNSDSQLGKFLYCLINIGLIAAGTALRRRALMVFGAFGVIGYLGYLSYQFTDALMFPIALVALGLGIVYLGVFWQRNEERIAQRLVALMPTPLSLLLQRVQEHG